MISFNILGDCVSRDILTPIVNRGGVQPLQYVSFNNPVSIVSEKPETELEFEKIEKLDGVNFDKRCFWIDYNKRCFDYLFKKKSDYLIFDILDARVPMLKKGNHYITEMGFFNTHRYDLKEYTDIEKYVDIDPFVDISQEEMDKAVHAICEKLLNVYSPNQIIINKHFSVQNYCMDFNMIPFPTVNSEKIDFFNPHIFYNSQEGIKKTNELSCRLFDEVVNILHGCHVIEFPRFVMADRAHKWGLAPLHYLPEYYEYGSKALEIICSGYSVYKEKDELAKLHEIYSEKNELTLKKCEITSLKTQLQWAWDALNFSKSLIFDSFDGNKFIGWFENCVSYDQKVAVLKSRDVAGQILLKALHQYNIEVTLASPCYDFRQLSTDEIELCRKADIIISADVHSSAPIEYEDLKAVRIADIIK